MPDYYQDFKSRIKTTNSNIIKAPMFPYNLSSLSKQKLVNYFYLTKIIIKLPKNKETINITLIIFLMSAFNNSN
jgi:hypothetical protein